MSASKNITKLLQDYAGGNRDALDKLMTLVYPELRRMAEGRMRKEGVRHTLQPTALVNEAFLRLVDVDQIDWKNRAHFFGIAGMMMRRVLLDHARKKLAARRGGKPALIEFDEALHSPENQLGAPSDIIALDAALQELEKIDPRQAKLVELRYFGGLSIEDTALILQCSEGTVKREWVKAKAWIFLRLSNSA